MSLYARSVLIFSVLAGISHGQSFHTGWPQDASNNDMFSPKPEVIRGRDSVGSVSVQELERPLAGKGLKLLAKAKDLIARGDQARGMEQMRAALGEPGTEPYALSMLAAEHLKQGDFDSAIAELQSALQLMPGLAANQSNLALALASRRRPDEALPHARKALQLDPRSVKTRYVLGLILLELRQNEEAQFHLKVAAEEIPGAREVIAKFLTPVAR